MNHRTGLRRALGLWFIAAAVVVAVFVWLESQPSPVLLTKSGGVGNVMSAAPTRSSLPPTTVEFVQKLPPVDVTVFANPRSEVGRMVQAFLDPYTWLTSLGQPALRVQFVDPASNPARVRMNKIGLNGEMIMRLRRDASPGQGDDTPAPAVHVQALDQEIFLNTWARLAQLAQGQELPWIVIAQDGGSRPIDNPGQGSAHTERSAIGRWVQRLQKSGYRVISMPMSQLASVRTNEHVKLLVLPAPQQAIPPQLLAGPDAPALLWLTEPELAGQQAAFEVALGLMSVPPANEGKEESTAQTRLLGLSDFVDNELGRDMPAPVVMPGVLAFVPEESTSSQSGGAANTDWQPLLKNAKGQAVAWYRPGTAVVGDTDFISNTYLTQGGNPVFARRLLDYLLQQPHFIPPVKSHSGQLVFTESTLLTFSVLALFVIPLLFLLLAFRQWRVYRRLR